LDPLDSHAKVARTSPLPVRIATRSFAVRENLLAGTLLCSRLTPPCRPSRPLPTRRVGHHFFRARDRLVSRVGNLPFSLVAHSFSHPSPCVFFFFCVFSVFGCLLPVGRDVWPLKLHTCSLVVRPNSFESVQNGVQGILIALLSAIRRPSMKGIRKVLLPRPCTLRCKVFGLSG